MLGDKIWDVCNRVSSKSGAKISGLRDLFDKGEGTYSITTLQDKVEIIQAICKEANCKCSDIFDAFHDYYSKNNYKHILGDSKHGLCKLYMYLYDIEEIKGEDPDPDELSDKLHSIYKTSDPENKADEMIEAFFKSGQLSVFYGSFFDLWNHYHPESCKYFINVLGNKIDEKLPE